jgi:hypothetical protein
MKTQSPREGSFSVRADVSSLTQWILNTAPPTATGGDLHSTSSEFCARVRMCVCGVQSSWTNVGLLDPFHWDGLDIKVTDNGLDNQNSIPGRDHSFYTISKSALGVIK